MMTSTAKPRRGTGYVLLYWTEVLQANLIADFEATFHL